MILHFALSALQPGDMQIRINTSYTGYMMSIPVGDSKSSSITIESGQWYIHSQAHARTICTILLRAVR